MGPAVAKDSRKYPYSQENKYLHYWQPSIRYQSETAPKTEIEDVRNSNQRNWPEQNLVKLENISMTSWSYWTQNKSIRKYKIICKICRLSYRWVKKIEKSQQWIILKSRSKKQDKF